MKKISKSMKLPDILDAICELEAFEEYLEDKLKHNFNPFARKTDQNNLYETRKKLVKLHELLEAS